MTRKKFEYRGEFQRRGVSAIIHNKRLQFNVDMGLGKTVMTLLAIKKLLMADMINKVLIVAPKRVAVDVWADEVEKWDVLEGLEISTIVGDERARIHAATRDVPIYTINYENIDWLVAFLKQSKLKWQFDMVVADESTRLKAHRSHFRRVKSGKVVLYKTGGVRTNALAANAFTNVKRWVNLTGTFCPNGLDQVWPQMWFVDGGKRLGRIYTDFIERWFRIGWSGYGTVPHDHSMGEIMARIKDITFTLRAEDYLDLPEEVVNTIYIDLPPEVMSKYKAMEKEMFVELDSRHIEVFTEGSKLGKCQQMANGAIYYDKEGNWSALHDVKIEALKSVVEEAGGMPILVAYKYKSDLARLQKAFPKGRAFDKKAQTKKDFIAGKIPLLFLHPASAGHGVDGLQEVTSIICFFSLDWNVEERLQAIGRIGRVRQVQSGHNRTVFVHQIVAAATVDELILRSVTEGLSLEEALKQGFAENTKTQQWRSQ